MKTTALCGFFFCHIPNKRKELIPKYRRETRGLTEELLCHADGTIEHDMSYYPRMQSLVQASHTLVLREEIRKFLLGRIHHVALMRPMNSVVWMFECDFACAGNIPAEEPVIFHLVEGYCAKLVVSLNLPCQIIPSPFMNPLSLAAFIATIHQFFRRAMNQNLAKCVLFLQRTLATNFGAWRRVFL